MQIIEATIRLENGTCRVEMSDEGHIVLRFIIETGFDRRAKVQLTRADAEQLRNLIDAVIDTALKGGH